MILKTTEDAGNLKRKHQIAVWGKLALEDARTYCKTDYSINEGMNYTKEEYKHPN